MGRQEAADDEEDRGEEPAEASGHHQWRLMQIVESAESKLMRGAQRLSDGGERKRRAEMTNRRRRPPPPPPSQPEPQPQANSPPAPAGRQDDGPTPTNDLVRALISRDRRALLLGARRRHEASCRSDEEEAEEPAAASGVGRPEVDREPAETPGGGGAAQVEASTDSEQHQLAAIISKCHTSLHLSAPDPQQVAGAACRLARRALRSVSPGRRQPDKSGSLGGVGLAAPTTRQVAGEAPRRHSTYLFPSALASLGRRSNSSSSTSSSSETEPTTGQPSAADRHLLPDATAATNNHLQRARELAAGSKLRASASSPSALATPTNLDGWATGAACREPCCWNRKAERGEQQQQVASGGQLRAGAQPAALRDKQSAAARVAAHRKRHSLINVLQAGSARLNPRGLFQQHPTSASGRGSLDAAAAAANELYEPLIPESGFKIVVMGTSGSGKTSIIRRFLYNSFSHRHTPTVEDTYFLEFPYLKNTINISISDTSGTYQFPAMRKLAINSGDAFILVYGVDSPDSLAELEQLRQTILEQREQAYSEGASLASSDHSLATAAASASAASASSTTSGAGSQRSSVGSACAAHQQALQAGRCAPLPVGTAERHATAGLAAAARYWSLGSIFHANQDRGPTAPPQGSQVNLVAAREQLQRAAAAAESQTRAASQCRNSSISSASSLCSSSCSSSADNSRRSSVSAAEAALRTRRTRRPPMVIVANKLDLPADRHLVNSDEAEARAVIDWNNGFVRASAALNINIDDIFQQVLRQAKQPPTLSQAMVSKRRKSLPPKLPTGAHHTRCK